MAVYFWIPAAGESDICNFYNDKTGKSIWKERWICLWADFLKYCLSSNHCVWKGRVYRSGSGEKYRSIIASAITGGIGIILLVLEVIAVVALGLFAVSDLTVQQTQDAVISQEVPEETQEEPDVKEEEDVQREYEGTPIEGYEDFETVSLDGYQWVTDVTLFKDGENTVTESTATSAKDGIELKAGFTLLAADETIEQRISAEVQNIRKTLESQAGIYTDITAGEMVAEDGFVMQQLICNQIGADGVAYPCTEIIQVQLMEDREILVSSVFLNTSQATENTERLFTQACELYGIAFQ